MYVQIPYFFDLFKPRLTSSEDSLQDKQIHPYVSLSLSFAQRGPRRKRTSTVKNNSVYHLHNYHFSDENKRETRRTYSNIPPFTCIRDSSNGFALRPRRADPHTGFYPVNVRGRVRVFVRVLPHNLHIVARQKPPARGHFSPTAQPADFFPREYIISRKVFARRLFFCSLSSICRGNRLSFDHLRPICVR